MHEEVMSVQEKEFFCYEYFHRHQIESRAQLRDTLKNYPLYGIRWGFVEEILSDFLYLKKLNKQQQQVIESNSKKLEKIAVINDVHIPFQDDDTLKLVFDCITNTQPKYLVLNGDILDCYSLSTFNKRPDRIRSLQDEINVFYKLMLNLKKNLPNTEIHYVFGNHEDRIEKNLILNPGLYGLDNLEPRTLLKLDKLGIFYHRTKVIINGFIYYHGDIARQHASYSAKAEFEAHKMQDGISAHTHRIGCYAKTYEQKATCWFENGCLCDLNPEYIRDSDKANWQQAFAFVNSFEGINQVDQILINDHKFVYNDIIYK